MIMDKMDQAAFVKCLTELKDLASLQGNVVSEEQIREGFAALDLNEEQYALIYEYLKKEKIGVNEPIDAQDYYTPDDKKYMQMYLEELKSIPQLSDGKKQALLMNLMAGDMSMKNELMESYLLQIVDIARLYAGQGVSMEDLIGEGNVALAVLMDMLPSQEDPKEADEMISRMIMRAMEELIEENAANKDEFSVWADKANEVMEKARELSEELLRKVTIDELCEHSGFERSFIEQVLEVTGGKIEYIEQ